MKHSTPPRGKCRRLILALMLLFSMTAAWADDSGLITQQITVNVATKGTLSNIIQSDKMFKITNLKITGELNSDDFTFIRKMAGCYYDSNRHKYDGHLEHLDLGGVHSISYPDFKEVYDENGNSESLSNCVIPLSYLYNLKTVVLPRFNGNWNFSLLDCRSLTTVEITGKGKMTNICDEALKGCSSLTSVTIPSTVTSIGVSAFWGCSSLARVSIPSTVTSIGASAFRECNSLTSISLPSLKNIAGATFMDCTNLQYILCAPVESIGSRAFSGCSNLTWTGQMIGSSTTLGPYVFEDCKKLEHITLPENMTTLPSGTFKGCTSLPSVKLPLGLTSIGDYAFDGCSSLEKIDLPYYLTSLGYRALAGCSKLTSLSLPSSLQSIGSNAFDGCSALANIYANMAAPVTASRSTFDGVSFSDCYLYVPSGTYQAYWLANGWGSFDHIVDNLAQQKSKMVTVETAGTLSDLIGNDKLSITHLKVSGPLNTYDIQCIREMAGCYTDANGSKSAGQLHHLDLAGATYTTTGPSLSLYRQSGQDGTFYITTSGSTNYPHAIFAYLDGLQSVILPKEETTTGEYMFFCCANLASASLENTSLTTIGKSTFCGCSSLTAIKVPTSCTAIGDYAFRECSNLESCYLEYRVNTIGTHAFYDCSSLKAINIPYGVTAIKDWTFRGCTSLTGIDLPKTLKSIGDRAFCLCTGLTSIALPESVESLANGVFLLCSGMKTVTLPAGLKTVSDNTFNGCTGLTSITANMTTPATVGENTFTDVPYDKCYLYVPEGSLEAYKAAEGWRNFSHTVESMADGTTVAVDKAGTLGTKISSDDKNKIKRLKVVGPINIDDIQFLREMAGCWIEEKEKYTDGTLQYLNLKDAQLVGGDKSINVYKVSWLYYDKTNACEAKAKIEADGNNFSNLFRRLLKLNTVVMPENLATTGYATFAYSPVTSVSLSPNLTTVGDSTFSACNKLQSIDLPASVTRIGTRAFSGCTALGSISFTSSLTSIGAYAFAGCGFTEFTVPENVTGISDGLFDGCGKLTSITMPKGLTAIGKRAFAGCAFTEFTVPEGITAISDELFSSCDKLKTVTLPKGLTAIGTRAFAGCGFTKFTIPDAITTISDYLFANCPNLEEVTFPKDLKSVGKGIFSGCGFSVFTLPRQITAITDYMFSDCANLEHIYLHDGLKSIGDYAFQYCNSLGGMTMPASVTKIGKGCFSHCDYLKEGVTLSDAITEIPDEAFAFCDNLYEIKLPAELRRIGRYAFEGSYSIGTISGLIIPSKVTEIAEGAFYKSFLGCKDLVLPASLRTIGEYAFYESSAEKIHSFMQVPLPLSQYNFDMGDRSQCKLYVPKGTAQKYRNAEVWKEFDIEEMDPSGIDTVTDGNAVKEVARYDAEGHLLTAPTKGLNIVRYSDGTIKKVVVE